MAKSSIGQVTTTQTFQNWLDKTNEIVTLLETDVMTASALGDTTNGNATLVGSFTANTVIAFDTLRSNVISPKVGSTSISISSPVSISSSTQTAQTLVSTSGPRVQYSTGSILWSAGFENVTNNNFIINTGSGSNKLTLTPTGDLSLAGSVTAPGGFIGNLTGNVTGDVTGNITGNVSGDLTGDVFASNGSTKILENGNGTSIAAVFTGNVTGTVSSLSNHTTNNLAEGGSNLYFTNARARAAVTGGTGVTVNASTGVISIGQPVGTTSNVNFGSGPSSTAIAADGAITATGDITAFASSSDIRKKENISRIENALEKVLSVGGYTYNFIGDDRPITGVIAQEIEKVLPEAVYEIDDEALGKTKAVRYGNIVGLLIEAIKEMSAEIEELKRVK